jgi:hypothetical protein
VCIFSFACGESSSPSQQPATGSGADPAPRSGLPEETAVRALDAAGRDALCTWWGDTLGNGRMQQCSECNGNACIDYDVAVSTQEDCVTWMQGLVCDATVRDAEDCAFAQQPDLCGSPAACDPFDAC